ncbi:demethylmenaquinone methyltransferase / 2-methoxy-6-polyprenyl-1,4-benzoquinol methylase [Tistlia consotensis]|uniref:Ubiquinone/menaquinone biosynthesis C-methyltransferase UbiE n=1 Tax=Tistlia consotensis USBA 355 TaxID=560819 RepID=A0A1Y6B7A8_9PROT|nr:class I SAM-dependent methyltransferase [Tistlia consotensis]SME93982.1 2-octaprenyl-6-methoxy-1,4-benzoquinone methylase /demethylmenaquinone methyltransferase [Tistlia consotensis USBA 355]SNR28968.1 demethylmenaquinone methyltransferase / 2-methoxy-6-polyprenyl-1,4-benzoquinol methylase [Tistlia consotensis]
MTKAKAEQRPRRGGTGTAGPSDGKAEREAGAERVAFGEREVDARDKPGLVRDVFRSVAGRYDLMNDLMSLGIHRLWKDAMLDRLRPRAGEAFLDVAGGTGDIAFRILDRTGGAASVTVLDLTEDMLQVGRDRAVDSGRLGGLDWVCGDAEALPLPDGTFDAYTIAFGLRNVTHIDRALAEARRVLKPGGRFLCLEFSRVVLPVLDRAYDLWSDNVLPRLGGVVARDRESYVYLVESIRRFPPQDELVERIRAAGLEQVRYANLSGGIAALHSAWRI